MAANDALLASLLLGQKQRRDPLEIYQSFGKQQVQAGSSTAPLGSGNALEGIARALQGGIGGLMQGYGLGKQEEQDTATSEGLQKAALAKTPEEYAEAMKGVRGSEGNAVLGQIAQNRLAEILLQRQAGNKLGPLMGDPGTQTAAAQAPQGAPMQQGGGAAPPGGIPQPGYGASTSPGGVYQARLSGYESTDRPQIVNPQSGAGGLFQFLPGTWDETRKANPQLNLPATVGQANEVQQKAAEEAFRAGNAKALQAAGIEPTPGNLYLAHRAGAQGAQTILQASPDTPLSTIVPPIWLEQNPDMRTTAGQFVAQANQRFPGGGQAAPGQPGPVAQPPQIAQGSGPTAAAPQGPPTAMSSPAGDQLRQRAQASVQAGDKVTALKFAQAAAEEDAKWATEVGKKNLDQTFDQSEWDRRQKATAAAGQPQQAFSNESKLRGEYEGQPAIKSYNTVVPILAAAKQAGKTRAGDLNLIYAFAKLMDPDSVVRESETGAVVATQSVMDRIGAYVGQLNGQQMLNDDARAKLMAELNGRFGELQKSRDALAQQYGSIASAHGLAPDRVVTSVRPPESAAPAPAAPPPAAGGGVSEGATATNPQTGQKVIFRGGQWMPAQ